jgi:uncharacterized protein YejL (UPF0352 family)
MSLAAELAAVLARHGAPTSLAVEVAQEVAASVLPKIERAERNRKIAAQFNGRNIGEMCELFTLSRRMVYYIAAENRSSAMKPISGCAIGK